MSSDDGDYWVQMYQALVVLYGYTATEDRGYPDDRQSSGRTIADQMGDGTEHRNLFSGIDGLLSKGHSRGSLLNDFFVAAPLLIS